ncbi:Hpt domain-containing protein [Maricaulis sp.]|uniref:Hpt domain-containing protein n=1 Tax=Maricaulis sp. TaxID=1486257 RepID=UPI0025C5194F|nr:Hpt domain-containing protein [Maricaulis sp.]
MIAAMKSTGSPLFDAAHLARYTGDDAALRAELLDLMCEQARRCLAIMEAPGDPASWRAACHTLKGAARGVGAFALADICDEVEPQPETAWPGARLAVEHVFRETELAFAAAD